MSIARRPRRSRTAIAVGLGGLLCSPLWAAQPKEGGPLDDKAFARPELTLSTSHAPLEEILDSLPNRAAWEEFSRKPVHVFIDPRSGAVTNIIGAFPLIPGGGDGNRLTLADLSASLGREVGGVDRKVVADLFHRFVRSQRAVLNIDVRQLGPARVVQVNPEMWQIHVPQDYQGVRVRDARLAGSINNGNLVVIGTEAWGDVQNLEVTPSITGEQAQEAGFTYAGGRSWSDEIMGEPTLEIVPEAPPEHQSGEAFSGPVGSGYRHRLVWTFVFRRAPDESRWEVMVDAHSGEVIAFQDINHYGEIKGGVYPLTNTGQCPDPERCGALQSGYPMPYADTGLGSPNSFTSGAGLYDSTAGNATTKLSGRFIKVVDACGPISESSASPTLDLGGTNGQHDCTSAGASPGDTSSARSSFYELNRIAEMARGWLPTNTWLFSQLTANVNINNTCNAFWNGSTVNFYRSGGGCRNTGEIAAIFDHEWGHGLDDNDVNGAISNSGEGYADIAAIYRLNASCVGYGFWWTSNQGCGQTADGTGFNQNEAQVGAVHCDLDCSGVRDADWDKHSDHQPDTALGFVCGQCLSGTGPCGRQVHCAAAPARQAAWDLVARDLQAAPYNHDPQTALIIGNRLFYQGSGNIGSWHACTCGSTSSGCGATNGYMQWLTADDDNGNLADGTPHMGAIFNAFNRHGIACSVPAPQNGGCGGGPAEAPLLTATPGISRNELSWTASAGATRYWVFRTEGHAGCDFGKTLIDEVTGTSYTDILVTNGRPYSYNVMAVGSSRACSSPASACVTAAPSAGPDFAVSCSPSSLSVFPGGSETSTCAVTSSSGFAGEVALDCSNLPAGASCTYTPGVVTVPADGSAASSLVVGTLSTTPRGTHAFKARGVSGSLTHTFGMTLKLPDFTLTCSPSSLTIPSGWNSATNCTLTSMNGFTEVMSLSCANLPPGWSCAYNPNPVTLLAGASATSLLNVAVSAATPPGSYSFQARAVGGSLTRTYDIAVAVPDFTLTCSPSSLVIAHAGTGTSTCALTALHGATPVGMSCTNLPPGVTCAYNPNPVMSSATTSLTVGVSTSTPKGTYGFQVQGTGGSITRVVNMTLQVVAAAAFDPVLKAPKCGTVSSLCDSGTLLVGRDGKGPEPNQPNTIGASCLDGTFGTFHVDESNDRLTVSTLDGTRFAPGKLVKIEATVWAYGSFTSDKLDLYYAADATSPAWIYLTTLTPAAAGQRTLSATYTLPAGTLQAVRARFRFGGSVSPCLTSSFDDHDDLVFAVNRPPAAQAGGPYSGVRNQAIAFNDTGSSDPDGDALTYHWDFGDGATSTGPSPAHVYSNLGTYTATLVVSDGIANSAPATATVTIANQAPVARPGGPYQGVRNQAIEFDGTASSDPDGDTLTYHWDFGDGTTGTGPVNHAYTTLGTYTVTLVVNDGLDSSAPATTTATIENLPPSVQLTSPGQGGLFHAPADILLAASPTDTDGAIASVEYFQGTTKIGETLTSPHSLLWAGVPPGAYVLSARATDDSGASTTSAPVTILVNAPPTVSLTTPASGTVFPAPASVTLTASASDVDGSMSQVEFLQGSTSIGVVNTSPYTLNWSGVPAGVYSLTARATDDRGATTASTPVTITVEAHLGPTADAYVRDGSSANRNFGSATSLLVRKGSTGANRWTYLKFDTSGLSSVRSATVRLFGRLSGTTSATVVTSVFPSENTSWLESTITWNNRPAAGTTALTSVTMDNGSTTARWYAWDVTAYLQQEKAAGRHQVTLVFQNPAAGATQDIFSSKEAASNRPELVLVP